MKHKPVYYKDGDVALCGERLTEHNHTETNEKVTCPICREWLEYYDEGTGVRQ